MISTSKYTEEIHCISAKYSIQPKNLPSDEPFAHSQRLILTHELTTSDQKQKWTNNQENQSGQELIFLPVYENSYLYMVSALSIAKLKWLMIPCQFLWSRKEKKK